MAYGAFRSITVDHTLVPSDLTNFPVLVSVTLTDLKTGANGGLVQDSNGYDIVFSSTSDGTSLLNWEVVEYDATTGKLIAWVKIATLSSSADTVFYLVYDNGAISTFQGNVTGTWSVFQSIWHFDGSGPSMVSSTGTTTLTNHSISAAAGQVSGGGSFNGSTAFADSAAAIQTASLATRSLACWFKTSDTGSQMILRDQWDTGVGHQGCFVDIGEGAAGKIKFNWQGGGGQDNVQTSAAYNDGNWHRVVVTFNSGAAKIYVDGSLITSKSSSITSIVYGAGGNVVEVGHLSSFGLFFTGSLDEAWIASVELTADWISAEFANQNSPGTFYTVGAAQTGSPYSFDDSITLIDFPALILELHLTYQDSFSLSDTFQFNAPIIIDVSDLLDIEDEEELDFIGFLDLLSEDSFDITDEFMAQMGVQVVLSEALVVDDIFVYSINNALVIQSNDTLFLFDSSRLEFLVNYSELGEAVTIEDIPTVQLGIQLNFSEDVNFLLDSVLGEQPPTELSLILSDVLELIDSDSEVVIVPGSFLPSYIRRYLNDVKLPS